VLGLYLFPMDNKSYQKNYRKTKQISGWKYFSVIVPPDFYIELKKFYLHWKIKKLKD
jgi:hypothetical protein